jgi:outer membrane protein OmpA-like peptidoglycan-associated protein/opacity protein-like surface antigen
LRQIVLPAAAGLACLLGSAAARAQNPAPPAPAPGFMEGFMGGSPYVGIAGGYSLLQDVGVNPQDGPFGPGPAKERFGDGFIGAGAVGWAFTNGFQVDVLGAYQYSNVNNLVPVPSPGKQTGHEESYGAFLEELYAFDLPSFGMPITWMKPYIGVGEGALWTHVNLPEQLANGDLHHIGGTSGANFAYEGIVGAAFPIPSVPGLAVTADYRLVGIHNPGKLNSVFYNQVDDVIVKGPIGLQKDVFVHNFTVGIAYAFNAAPPPPPPAPVMQAPAPAPARTYLVFFDWDKSYLTPRARQIVAEAASNSTHTQVTTIEVNGYADTSHALPGARGQAYNLRLSLRRADAVKADLIRDGVPANVIMVHGYGDTHLLVPTGPNVREPQNRRVEIILQ